MLIDAHAHLDFKDFEKDLNLVIKRFNGIIIQNSVDYESMKKTLDISEKYENVKAALGIYPLKCLKLTEKELNEKLNFIKKNKNKIIALGEIGIDLKESSEEKKQIKNLKKFIRLSEEIKKPMIVHSRKAEDLILEVLKDTKSKVILHFYSGNVTQVKKALEYGFYFSVPTIISNSKNLKKLIKIVPLNRILTETDCPYLSPTKEKRNEPVNVKHTISVIAKIKNVSEKEVENQIYKNYKNIFE